MEPGIGINLNVFLSSLVNSYLVWQSGSLRWSYLSFYLKGVVIDQNAS
jgi:hypothetical protein